MDQLQNQYELIESTVHYIRRLSIGIKKEMDTMRIKGIVDLNIVTEISEGLSDLLKAIVLTADITKISHDDSVNKVKENLKDTLDACYNKDVVYIIDVFTYEILPTLEEWRIALVAAYKNKSSAI